MRGLVFQTERGYPVHGANLAKLLRAALIDAGLPVVTVHQLRHSFASWLLTEGVDLKVVSDLLGHSRIGITADLYQHVSEPLRRDAINRIGEALG